MKPKASKFLCELGLLSIMEANLIVSFIVNDITAVVLQSQFKIPFISIVLSIGVRGC